jgi:PAS domain S-box-containing protein/diguanylate cyclase (GGDEF)-like protein
VTVVRDVTARREDAESLRMQARILDSVGQAVIVCGLDARIQHWNRAAEEIYGWSAEEVLGADVREITTYEDQAEHIDEISDALVRGESWTGDFWSRRRDGTRFPVLVTDTPIFDDRGQLIAIVGISSDITERVAAEAAREADRQRLEEAQRIGGLGSYELDLASGELVYSQGLYELLEVDPDTTPTVDLYRTFTHPEDALALEEAIQRALLAPTELEHRIIMPDGAVRWVRWQAIPVDDGTKIAGVVLDITARREAELALAHAALHDPLTGLANRTLLESRLLEAAAEGDESGSVVGVLAIGVDHLGIVNEELGHEAGDDLLVQVGQRLTELAGAADTVARLAADEFIMVRAGADRSWGPARLARIVERAMAEPFDIGGRSVFITVSIGAVEVGPGPEPTRAVRLATDAMARAKGRGRAQTYVAEANVVAHPSANRLDTASALRRAIDRDELRVHYQPVVEFEPGRVCGFEALVRWQHPERGLLQPGQFIEIAEDTGLILDLGRWVLGEAIAQVARWRADSPEPELSIAVNVSARQLRTADLLVDLCEHLERHGLPAGAVHLEITESVLMDDVESSIESLVALKSIGVQIDVDDFGTGFSSLNYLKRLPIDGLKIDQSFVAGLGIDKNDSAITHAIARLADALDLAVIAEGVETEDQARQLVDLGCHSAQGYLWSRPVAPDEAFALITGQPVAFGPFVGARARIARGNGGRRR